MTTEPWEEETQGEPKYTQKYIKAIEMACELHKCHYRKGTEIPYIAHLLDTSSIVWKHGGTETESCAAVLHDAVEDQGGLPTLEKIRLEFGEGVADIVEGCSELYEGKKPKWKVRKTNYINQLKVASQSTLLVSASDKLSNIQDTLRGVRASGDAHFKNFSASKESTLWFYRGVVKVFEDRGGPNIKMIAGEIAEIVTSIEGKT